MTASSTIRSLAGSRVLSITVVVTLAIAVAALTTTFGVVNAAILRQPPFDDARRLAMLYLERHPVGEAPRQDRWSFARYELLRAWQKSFEYVASYSPASVTLSVNADAELITGTYGAARVCGDHVAAARCRRRGVSRSGVACDTGRPHGGVTGRVAG